MMGRVRVLYTKWLESQAADSARGLEPKTSCGRLPEGGAESIYVALGQPARGLAC